MVKILIVEDSAFFRRLLKETLLSRFPEMDILEAYDGNEALQKIEISLPDIIFMDIKLPGENGLEVTRKIKSRHPNIPVIILTSYDLPEYREAANQCKVSHFLSKGTATKEDIFSLVESLFPNRNIDLDGQRPESQS